MSRPRTRSWQRSRDGTFAIFSFVLPCSRTRHVWQARIRGSWRSRESHATFTVRDSNCQRSRDGTPGTFSYVLGQLADGSREAVSHGGAAKYMDFCLFCDSLRQERDMLTQDDRHQSQDPQRCFFPPPSPNLTHSARRWQHWQERITSWPRCWGTSRRFVRLLPAWRRDGAFQETSMLCSCRAGSAEEEGQEEGEEKTESRMRSDSVHRLTDGSCIRVSGLCHGQGALRQVGTCVAGPEEDSRARVE